MFRQPLRFNLRWCPVALPAIAMSGATAVAGPYSPLPGQTGSMAVSAASSNIVEWASGATIVRGLRNVENPTEYSSAPSSALNFAYYGGSDGASDAANAASLNAGGGAISSTDNTAPIGAPPQPQSAYYAVALGQNGSATVTFNHPITNGAGPDFAVFNNGFSAGSQEWVKPALVSVSSDGVHFFAFPSVSLTQTTIQVGNYGLMDPTNLYDIAGSFPAGYGTPFDLTELAGVSPLLNVNDVIAVRIASVAGDINPAYATYDSRGNIINAPWQAFSVTGSEGFNLAGIAVLNDIAASGTLIWSNAAATGSWNTSDSNWNTAAVVYHNGDNVQFDNSSISSSQTISLSSFVSPGSITVNNSTGAYTIAGTGGIAGTATLLKTGSQRLILSTANIYTGPTIVNAGILELATPGALPANNTLTIASGARVIVDSNTGPLLLSSLNPGGSLDLENNGLILHNGNLAAIISALKSGRINTSTAAADSTHLTTLGVIQNINPTGGTIYSGTFDGATGLSLTTTDVLVKYTYYGDANLDGHVDGSDYSLIDNGYLHSATTWQNGDFNCDGVVNGSDYTLIDNAFNLQGASMSANIASPQASVTAQIAAVPEPTSIGLNLLVAFAALRRRRRRGFTVIELLVVVGIISILTGILLPSLYRVRQQSQMTVCASNIRQLALANLLYANDNHFFCVLAAADIADDLGDGEGGHYRWHGYRAMAGQPFDPAQGPLAPYLGKTGQVKNCPTFDPAIGAITGNNFEQGCGGYGYNETYVGGRYDLYGFDTDATGYQASQTSAKISQIRHSSETVMFTDAGIAQPVGATVVVTEYSFCEAPYVQEAPGAPSTDRAWPSIHFRHRGRANVAWADGHVTAETLAFSNESYGLTPAQVQQAHVGWFGPDSNALFQITR